MKSREVISIIEEKLIQEFRKKEVDRELIASVAYISSSLRVSKLQLKEYFNTPHHYFYEEKNTYLSKSTEYKLYKMKTNFNFVKIGNEFFRKEYLDEVFMKYPQEEACKKLKISTESFYKHARNNYKKRPKMYVRKKETPEHVQYSRLKDKGYKNATEYIIEHGARAYRQNIL